MRAVSAFLALVLIVLAVAFAAGAFGDPAENVEALAPTDEDGVMDMAGEGRDFDVETGTAAPGKSESVAADQPAEEPADSTVADTAVPDAPGGSDPVTGSPAAAP